MATIESAFETVDELTRLLGVRIQKDKVQGPSEVTIVDDEGKNKTIKTGSFEKP